MKRKLGNREKITFIIAGAVLLGGVYAMTRVKMREDDLKLVREEAGRIQAEIAAIRPALGGNDAQAAEAELAAARVELEKQTRKLTALNARQVDVASSQAVQEAMLEVTLLASRHGVKLKSAEAATNGVGGMRATQSGVNPIAGRPLRQLTLVGRYADLSAFLTDLPRARHAVTIMRFALKAAAPASGEISPPIDAEVLILL